MSKVMNIALNTDCMEYMAGLADNEFDIAIVDPPYGIGADRTQFELGGQRGFGKGAGRYARYHETDWDAEPPAPEYFQQLLRVSRNQIIWGGNYFDVVLTGVVVWNKGGSGNFKEGEMAKTSFNTFKVFTYSRADAYINSCDAKIHPTQKPVALYKWLLQNYAKEGDTILDTHLGSGSSRIAAHDLGFDFVGTELDKDYFEAQERRFAEHIAQPTFAFEPTMTPTQEAMFA